MYFQQPVEGVDHDLKRLKRKTVKRIAGEHLHPPDMPKIAKEMLVEPAKMLLYLIMNLKHTPLLGISIRTDSTASMSLNMSAPLMHSYPTTMFTTAFLFNLFYIRFC